MRAFVLVDVDAGLPLVERQKTAAALQRQLREHYAPYWDEGFDATVRAATPISPALAGEVEVRLQKTVTEAGALAYHDRKPTGEPICYVFTELCAQSGEIWSSAASHEILELMGDPFLHLCVELDNGEIWDRENCDRVQALSYDIDGVTVSDFNTPYCFEPPVNLVDVKFDYMGKSNKPNQTLGGGYSQKFDIKAGWTIIGQLSPYRAALLNAGLGRVAKRGARLAHINPFVRLWRKLFG